MNRIKQLRTEKNLTQESIAKILKDFSKKELEEIKNQIEFIKWKKKHKAI